jgi:hypothetical protein
MHDPERDGPPEREHGSPQRECTILSGRGHPTANTGVHNVSEKDGPEREWLT